MKKKSMFLLVIILLFTCSLSGQDDQQILKLISNTGKFNKADKVIIFDSTKVDVQPSGLSYCVIHTLTKVLTPKGAIDLKNINFNYDPQSAFIEIKRARIIKKDSTIINIPLNEVVDYTAPARMIYWGAREKMIPVGRLEPGDAVEILVFRKGFTYALLLDNHDDERYIPPMKGHYYDIVPFYSKIPIIEKVYQVILQKNKPIQYKVYNGELTSSVFFTKDDKIVYTWSKKDIKPLKREANMVSFSDVAPKLLLSTAPDWNSKSLWFYNVNEDYGSFDVTPEVQKKTDEIIAGTNDEMEKISRLTHWVAENIRYSGLTMGEGEGFTLHKGEMTFKDRCGVCKDKAGMLVTMLRAAGFESYPAMTMAGSRIDYIPADQFNHSVTLVKKSDGDYELLDPTWVPGVRELWSSAEQQQQYLMGVPETADLKTTPISAPKNHYYRVKGKSKLSADGTLKGSFSISAEGQTDSRIRRMIKRGYKANWCHNIELLLYNISSNIKIKKLDFVDPYDISKPMVINVSYIIPDYAVVDDNNILFTPLLATHPFYNAAIHKHLFMDVDLKSRKYDFKTRCSKLIELEEDVELPKYKKVVHVPQQEAVEGSGANFSAKYTITGRKLKFTEQVILKKRIYSPDDYPSFRDAVRAEKQLAEEYLQLIK